jgi:hypothetical protein
MMTRTWPVFVYVLPLIAAAQIEGAIDLHVHSAPDSMPRALSAIETAQIARRHGMRAVLYKNHFVETATLAYLVEQVVPEVEAYGGIVLNRSVGGINPAAVEQMAAMTGGRGRVVWMPTVDAAQGPFAAAVDPADILPVSRDGALLPEVLDVLELIAELDLALATGHSSSGDSLLLVRAASRPENVVVSTDLGQPANPVPAVGFAMGVGRLLAAGFTEAEVDLMIRRNPARLLDLDL